jgi:cytoskeletal protein RodZ
MQRYNKNKNTTKNTSANRLMIVLLIVAVLSLLGFIGYKLIFENDTNITDQTTATNENDINYDPPTEEEKQQANDTKNELPSSVDKVEPQDTNLGLAEVVIVDANQYDNEIEIRAFVANYIMNGTCTLTFTRNDLTVKRSVEAYSDATTTPCVNTTIPSSEFSEKGTWELEVRYDSGEIYGSATQKVEVR